MAFGVRSATRLPLSGLGSVSICLCAFGFLPIPQLAVQVGTESAEGKCPGQEDRESSEEELIDRSSARRRLSDRKHSDLSRAHETGYRLPQVASYFDLRMAVVGHQLGNGLGAPLLI